MPLPVALSGGAPAAAGPTCGAPLTVDAWALTDHGNGSGLAHAYKHSQKVKKAGKKYRQIYGCEFYFVPSLTQWRDDYEQAKIDRAAAKQKALKEDDDAGHVVENEEETKNNL